MRGRWLDSTWNNRETPDPPPGPALYTTTELLNAARADNGIQALYDEIADIVNDRKAEWRRHAACLGSNPELWFPQKGELALAADAVTICNTCPVTVECDNYATSRHIRYGVWGGKAGRNRHRGTWDRGTWDQGAA